MYHRNHMSMSQGQICKPGQISWQELAGPARKRRCSANAWIAHCIRIKNSVPILNCWIPWTNHLTMAIDGMMMPVVRWWHRLLADLLWSWLFSWFSTSKCLSQIANQTLTHTIGIIECRTVGRGSLLGYYLKQVKLKAQIFQKRMKGLMNWWIDCYGQVRKVTVKARHSTCLIITSCDESENDLYSGISKRVVRRGNNPESAHKCVCVTVCTYFFTYLSIYLFISFIYLSKY